MSGVGQPELTTGDFARMDGAGYRSTPYDPPNAGGGLQFGRGGYGLQVTPGAVAAMDEGMGEYALKRVRDDDVAAEMAALRRQNAARVVREGSMEQRRELSRFASTRQVSDERAWDYRGSEHAGLSPLEWQGVLQSRMVAMAGDMDPGGNWPTRNEMLVAGLEQHLAALPPERRGSPDMIAAAALGIAPGSSRATLNDPLPSRSSIGAEARAARNLSGVPEPISVTDYVSGLYRKETPTGTSAGRFEVEQAGKYNYRVVGGGTAVDIDGYKGTTILETKHVGDAARSPYIADSSIPSFLREKILKEQQYEFQRLKAVVSDPAVPFRRVEVLTNHNDAVPYFRALMNQYEVPGAVRVVPTQVPPTLPRKP